MVNTARQNLKSALINATDNRQEREAMALEPKQNVIRGRVTAVGSSGVVIRTENNGRITIPRRAGDAQGYTPVGGEIVQVSTSGGVAKIISNSQAQPQAPVSTSGQPFLVSTDAPLTTSVGLTEQPFLVQLTGEVDSGSSLPTANLYAWTGSLPTYAQISGASTTPYSGMRLLVGNQTFTEDLTVAFDWDYSTHNGQKLWDTNNYHSTTTNSDRITFSEAGYYQIIANFRVAIDTGANAETYWRVGMVHYNSLGTQYSASLNDYANAVTFSRTAATSVFPINPNKRLVIDAYLECQAGDYVVFFLFVESTNGTAGSTGIQGTDNAASLTVNRLSGLIN